MHIRSIIIIIIITIIIIIIVIVGIITLGFSSHSLLRWRMIILKILSTSIHFLFKGWDNVLFERKTGVVMSEDEHFRARTGLQIGQTRKTPDQKNKNI